QAEADVEIAVEGAAPSGERALKITARAGADQAEARFRLKVQEPVAEFGLAVSPEVVVYQGGGNRLEVRVARSNPTLPVRVRLDGDVQGVEPREFSLEATETAKSVHIQADAAAAVGARIITAVATAGSLQAETRFRLVLKEAPAVLRLAVPDEIRINQHGQ